MQKYLIHACLLGSITIHVESPISLFRDKNSSGISISHAKTKDKTSIYNTEQEPTNRHELKKQSDPVLAAFDEFDSPFEIAYDLESGAGNLIMIEKINAEKHTDIAELEPEKIAKPVKPIDEKPTPERVTISPEELTLIHDQLVFENIEIKDFVPDSFSIDPEKSDEEDEEGFILEHYMLTVKPDIDNQLDLSDPIERKQNPEEEEIALAETHFCPPQIEKQIEQDEIDDNSNGDAEEERKEDELITDVIASIPVRSIQSWHIRSSEFPTLEENETEENVIKNEEELDLTN